MTIRNESFDSTPGLLGVRVRTSPLVKPGTVIYSSALNGAPLVFVREMWDLTWALFLDGERRKGKEHLRRLVEAAERRLGL